MGILDNLSTGLPGSCREVLEESTPFLAGSTQRASLIVKEVCLFARDLRFCGIRNSNVGVVVG
jgi:hypothetical protein